MKIYFKSSSSWEFIFDREPMAEGKFYALVFLAAGALLVALLLCGSIIKHIWR